VEEVQLQLQLHMTTGLSMYHDFSVDIVRKNHHHRLDLYQLGLYSYTRTTAQSVFPGPQSPVFVSLPNLPSALRMADELAKPIPASK
jgi:hypothetical protein